jgi:hypothetical protein
MSGDHRVDVNDRAIPNLSGSKLNQNGLGLKLNN